MQPKALVYKIPLMQLILSVLLSLGVWCVSQPWGLSIFLGGISGVLPNTYLMWRYLRRQAKVTALSPKSVLTDFYLSVGSKMIVGIVVLVVMLLLCVTVLKLPVIPFIIGYAINQVVSSLLPIAYKTDSVGGA